MFHVKQKTAGKKGGKTMVKLYRIEGGELRLKDYGVQSQAESYAAQGYIVIVEK